MRLLSEAEQEEHKMNMRKALQECIDAESGRSLIECLDVLVQEEWLGGIDSMPGNIYRAAAFGCLPIPSCKDLLRREVPALWAHAKCYGAVFIWLTQIVGPTVLLINTLWKYDEWKLFSFGPWSPDKFFGSRFLALFLIILFNLNALAELESNATSWEKLICLFRFWNCSRKKDCRMMFMWIGAFTNCYVTITSCCCTCFLLGQAESTKDILFDALAILFLVYLDDIGEKAQVSFLTKEDWPGSRFSWAHEQMMKRDDVPDTEGFGCGYKVVRILMMVLFVVLPLFYVITDFNVEIE